MNLLKSVFSESTLLLSINKINIFFVIVYCIYYICKMTLNLISGLGVFKEIL